jgi:hypothetical protein
MMLKLGFLKQTAPEGAPGTNVPKMSLAGIPAEFQPTYVYLKSTLDSLETRLKEKPSLNIRPVLFAAELIAASSDRGKDLLGEKVISGVGAQLDRLKELGAGAVTVSIHFPLYTPDFPDYLHYVSFYRTVAHQVRARGLKLNIRAQVLSSYDYKDLDFESFVRGSKAMILAIKKDLRPDYINIMPQPETLAAITGLKEFKDPQTMVKYLNYVMADLNKGDTRIVTGAGSWENIEYLKNVARHTDVDAIALHIYPLTGQTIENIFEICRIARAHYKGIVLDDAWLYKADRYVGNSRATWTDVSKRDVFSFWAPLDQQFLWTLVKIAQNEGAEFVSPFGSRYLFAYIDYNESTAGSSYKELMSLHNKAAILNIVNDTFSSTGEYYRKLILNSSLVGD